MAIRARSGYAVILRPFTDREISSAAWKTLLRLAAGQAFDGEIMAFIDMDPMGNDITINMLERMGFVGPEGLEPDFAVKFAALPAWLELVDVRYLDGSGNEAKAWKLKDSQVYDLHDVPGLWQWPKKGYEVDWPPYIGKIRQS